MFIFFVLIIGFTIVLAAFITSWSVNRVKEVPLDNLANAYCPDVRIDGSVIGRTTDLDIIQVSVVNRGAFSIKQVSVQRETNNSALGTCDFLNLVIAPGVQQDFDIPLGGDLSTLKECTSSDLRQAGYCIGASYIALVPWIEVEGQMISCNDRKEVFTAESNPEISFCPT